MLIVIIFIFFYRNTLDVDITGKYRIFNFKMYKTQYRKYKTY